MGDAVEVAAQQRHAGGLDGHIRAGAHRQADVGGGPSWGVIDAVAGKRDHATFGAELVDDVGLVVGQHLGLDPVDAKVGGDRGRGDLVVAGEHDDLDALLARGIDISAEYPKPWTDEVVRAADVVVSMGCGDACPVFPGKRYEEWTLDDPAGLDVADVRPIRDDLERRVLSLLAELGVTPAGTVPA